jgi:hypothetical protein
VTAQFPNKLINKHPRVKLDGLRLYGVVRGDVGAATNGWGDGDAFTTQPTPPANAVLCTALWRGYVATFLLQEDGRLKLVAFEYMLGLREWQRQEVGEQIEGDFWLVMKPEFFGQRTYVPFSDGVIVEDQEEWFTEEPFEMRRQHLEADRSRSADEKAQ